MQLILLYDLLGIASKQHPSQLKDGITLGYLSR